MARTKSEFLASFGTAFEVFKGLADEVLDLGGSDDDLRRVASELHMPPEEVDALFRTCRTDEDVVAVGRALAQLCGSRS